MFGIHSASTWPVHLIQGLALALKMADQSETCSTDDVRRLTVNLATQHSPGPEAVVKWGDIKAVRQWLKDRPTTSPGDKGDDELGHPPVENEHEGNDSRVPSPKRPAPSDRNTINTSKQPTKASPDQTRFCARVSQPSIRSK